MAFAEATDPDFVSPWGSTVLNGGSIRRQAAKVRRNLAARPKRAYEPAWEDPGRHGSWREVDLRPMHHDDVTKVWKAPVRRLPRAPHKRIGAGETALLVGLVVGAGALAWWVWQRGRAKDTTAHVGDGLDMLGALDG